MVARPKLKILYFLYLFQGTDELIIAYDNLPKPDYVDYVNSLLHEVKIIFNIIYIHIYLMPANHENIL